MSKSNNSNEKQPVIKKRIGHTKKVNPINNKVKETKIVVKKTTPFKQPLPSFPVVDITSKFSVHALLAYINSKHNNRKNKNNNEREM